MARRRGPSRPSRKASLLATAAAALFLSSTVAAFPVAAHNVAPTTPALVLDAALLSDTTLIHAQEDASKPFTLRLMPLGASITEGIASTEGYGYRKSLRDQLRAAGWPVNMVGSKRNGGDTFVDQDNEGHPGWVISQINDLLPRVLWMKPNLVTINLGTNDCIQNIDVGNAEARMGQVVDTLLDKIDGVTVVLSTLLQNTVSDQASSNVEVVNAGYRKIVEDRAGAGKRVILADMDTGFIPTDMLVDGIHPNDDGYKRMAAVWWDAIQRAESQGLLQAPDTHAIDDSQEALTTCDSGKLDGPVDLVEAGTTGEEDGGYKHAEEAFKQLLSAEGVDGGAGVFFAEMVQGDEGRRGALDDLVFVDGEGKFSLWVNMGDGKFDDKQGIDPGLECAASDIVFGDLNNDGLDDIFCISSNGAATASLNRGGSPPTFENVGEVRSSVGEYPPDKVRMADVDGDGRVDYCVLEANSDVRCWRNGGTGDTPSYWQGFGASGDDGTVVFAGIDGNGAEGIVLADLNGDFRGDWLWVGDSGEIWTYINNRGQEGKSYVPNFTEAGKTHPELNATGIRGDVKLGRIYGSGRLDYVKISSSTLNVKKNTGFGGVNLAGDGVNFCDMLGTGRDDYVWISPEGSVQVYANGGDSSNPSSSWTDMGAVLDTKRDRRTLRVADWDGDGRCDILAVRDSDGALELWHNDYDGDKLTFSHTDGEIVSGDATCAQAAGGVSPFDLGVRLADIDADGRADYLCIEPNGRATGFLNPSSGTLEDVGQVKLSVDLDRANFRYVDVNADGLADLVWLDKFSGDARVWANRGRIPASGSSFTWDDLGVTYAGQDRGQNIELANVKGLRRGDYVDVDPYTTGMKVWWNGCEGKAVGDDATSLLPLPEYSSS